MLRRLLIFVDAELLRLYNLPARAERLLLDSFARYIRKGIPFEFKQYYPPDSHPPVRSTLISRTPISAFRMADLRAYPAKSATATTG